MIHIWTNSKNDENICQFGKFLGHLMHNTTRMSSLPILTLTKIGRRLATYEINLLFKNIKAYDMLHIFINQKILMSNKTA